MGFIYKITNQLNNKQYIGKTSVPIEVRWKGHLHRAFSDYNRNEHFINAIRKYGENNFKIELIEECEDSILNEREIYWIKYFDTYNNGYNSTIGGEGDIKYDRKEILTLWNNGYSLGDIQEKLGCQRETASKALQAQGIQEKDISKRGYEQVKNKLSRKIEQYDINGNLLHTYLNAYEASKATGFSRTGLINACQRNVFNNNYYWKYQDDNEPILEKIKNIKTICKSTARRVVEQYDNTGKLIATYNSVTEAANNQGMTVSTITNACSRTSMSSGGYYWKYADEDFNIIDYIKYCEEKKLHKGTKAVNKYNKNGILIKSYSALKDAAQDNNLTVRTISNYMKKHIITKNGIIWLSPNETELLKDILKESEI